MSVELEAKVPCARCAEEHTLPVEFLWGEDSPWHRYRLGESIRWKGGWRERRVPELGPGLRLGELDPVFVHGSGALPCDGRDQDFLIEVRGNRLRGVQALPRVPPPLRGFGWHGAQRDLFFCTHRGPSPTFPQALSEEETAWLRELARRLS